MNMRKEKLIIEKMLVSYTQELLRGKGSWGQGIYSVDKDGREVLGDKSKTVVKRNLIAAIWKTAEDFVNQWNETGIKCKLYDEVISMLTRRIVSLLPGNDEKPLLKFNDDPGTTQLDVLTLLSVVKNSIDEEYLRI